MANNAVNALNNVNPAPFSEEWMLSQQPDYNAIKLARENGDYDEYMAGRPVARGETTWEALTGWLTGSYDKYLADYNNAVKAYANQYTTNKKADSAYTRMVKDLQNAGINPYWALMNGGLSPVSGNAYEAYSAGSSKNDDSGNKLITTLLTTALLIMKFLA